MIPYTYWLKCLAVGFMQVVVPILIAGAFFTIGVLLGFHWHADSPWGVGIGTVLGIGFILVVLIAIGDNRLRAQRERVQ